MISARVLVLAGLTLSTPTLAGDASQVTVAIDNNGRLVECASATFRGWPEEEIKSFKESAVGQEGARLIEQSCDEHAAERKSTRLGSCLLAKTKGEKSLTLDSAYYDEESTFSDGGFRDQCLEMKGKWKVTAAGATAAARMALPKATSAEIGAEYEENEVAADKKYKGRKFLLTGDVQSVKKDSVNRPFIQARGGNPFIGVHLYLKDAAYAATLKAGDVVKLSCLGKGKGRLGAPTFDCE